MPVVAFVAASAGIAWGVVYARRGSLALGCVALLIVAYVLGHPFWHLKVGPLPITLDRLVSIGLAATFVARWHWGRLEAKPLAGADWLLAALLAWLTISVVTNGSPETVASDNGSPLWRLTMSFLVPAGIYWIARQVPLTKREWTAGLALMSVLGVYLGFTALAEIAKQWAFVFPRYIADPTLGIHFGRARGPELNSESLGVYLTVCLWCAWLLRGNVRRNWQLILLASLPLMAAGVFYTYTRSTWIGLAASGLVIGMLQLPRGWRLPLFSLAAIAAVLVAVASWGNVVDLHREGTGEESRHSVDQRKSFAYVSWQMFKDNPLMGVGFGRFYDRKLPYLSDRSQEFELESLRPLHHHNTLLSLLTETGMFGLAAFVGLLVAWARRARTLATNCQLPGWIRSQGALMLAAIVVYMSSAVFHDLTLLPSQQWLLFLMAGLTMNLCLHAMPDAVRESREFKPARNEAASPVGGVSDAESSARLKMLPASERSPTERLLPRRPQRQAIESIDLFGMKIARVTMRDAVDRVLSWCVAPSDGRCRYIVTPNVDHVVMFQHRADLRAAYSAASLVLADGAPLVLASRLLGKALPERVAGSDLVPQLFESASEPLRVFVLGAAPGVADRAAERIRRQWPLIRVVGTYSPPWGFERIAAENNRLLSAIAAAAPDLLVVGLGAPKQELWVHRHNWRLQAKVAICVGATIDFLAGERQRSPVWMRRMGLEWLHRVATEPRRLAGRYLRGAWEFPQLVWREWRRVCS